MPQALTTYGSEKLSLSDAQELLSQIEPDENGLINYVEFVNMSAPGRTRARRCLVSRRLAHAHATYPQTRAHACSLRGSRVRAVVILLISVTSS